MTRARLAVVTGANRGIGEGIARRLELAGLQVIPTSREPRDGYAALDVTRADHVLALAERVRSEGGLDVLVNNAGASFDGFDESVARRTLDVNFFGPLRVTDALLPTMNADARIVMVSSGMGTLSHAKGEARARFEDPALARAGLIEHLESFVREVARGKHAAHGWPSSAYSVSKMGLNALVRVLARELANDPRRILVNSADPGWVRTRMGGPSAPRSIDDGARTPVWLALLPAGGPSGGFFRDERPAAW
jgi:carbonyl reductase 1